MPQAGYVWTDPHVSLYLKPDVVKRVCRDALEAFEAAPRRGLEIGGILLGEVANKNGAEEIRIAGCEAVESEHRWGSGYRLSDEDVSRLDRTVHERPGVVGIYRTHASPESLTLQEHDAHLFHRYFKRSDGVVLLVAPLSGRGAAFLPHRGIAHEFRIENVSARVKTNAATKRHLWPAIAAVALGSIVGAAAMARFDVKSARKHTTAGTVSRAKDRLRLYTKRGGNGVELRWDPGSYLVRSATYAQLKITDDNHISQLKLSPTMLGAGMFQYWPQTANVGFRMDLFDSGGKVSDWAEAAVAGGAASTPLAGSPVTAPGPGAPGPSVSSADRRLEDEVKPSPFEAPPPRPPKRVAPPPAKRAPTPVPRPEPVVAVVKAPSISESKPVPLTPAPMTVPLTKPVVVKTPVEERPATVPATTPRRSAPHVSVDAEPLASSSRFGRAVAHIPLLRRLKRQPQAFVPPKPVREFKPALTESEAAWLQRPVPIDVKVYVGETGKVEFAEVLTNGRRSELASEAVYAARKWTFTPARMGDEAVPGEVILHFRFAPVE